MKKFIAAGLLALLVSVTTFAQDTKKFPVSGFNKLAMGSAFKIDVKQGSNFSVTASGKSEDLSDLEANVSGGVLKIGYKGVITGIKTVKQ